MSKLRRKLPRERMIVISDTDNDNTDVESVHSNHSQ